MSFSENDVSSQLTILRKGGENTQTTSEIEEQLHQRFGFQKSGNQVIARSLITYAIQTGHRIKSSISNPAGYWIEDNPEEIKKCISSLEKRANRIRKRANNLRKNIEIYIWLNIN
jgi:hypothetical protein